MVVQYNYFTKYVTLLLLPPQEMCFKPLYKIQKLNLSLYLLLDLSVSRFPLRT